MRVGFIGWRGMVGSVLMQRMIECGDFDRIEPTFFSTSAAGAKGPEIAGQSYGLKDAHDLEALQKLPVLVTCQGTEYTNEVYPKLRAAGWKGFFIDAAKPLRMQDEAVLILDPVNRHVIDQGLAQGKKTFCGPNCTVSLMVLAVHGLFRAGLVEWVSSMTYQAASGGGAQHMRELISQMARIGDDARTVLGDPASTALEIDARVVETLRGTALPTANFGVPLAGSLIPWIDVPTAGGQTLEEWKAHAEGNKILGSAQAIPMDGLCVRVGAMRCHSQALTIKLNADVPLDEVSAILAGANRWVRVIANRREDTVRELTPAAITGKLEVPIGRLHKMRMGPQYLAAFTVGDQLLWGAAEPLRRMLGILQEHAV